MKHYLFLAIAILCETIATSALKSSAEFSKIIPSIITILGYLTAFYFLSLTLSTIPLGLAYAMWSGIGIILITLAGVFAFKQIPDLPVISGLILIVAGVIVINLFSKTSAH